MSSRQRAHGNNDYRGRDYNRGGRAKSKVKCFNCNVYGHYVVECQKPRREREAKEEANIAQIPDDEPALLLTECGEKDGNVMLINEEKVFLKLNQNCKGKQMNSNLWYLDNGVSNHMTGHRSKLSSMTDLQ